MEIGNITSTNPYNFTYAKQGYENVVYEPYNIYDYGFNLLPWLILHYLKNVNLVLINDKDLEKALLNINITKWSHEHGRNSDAVRYGIIDATQHFYMLSSRSTTVHVSPSLYHEYYVIISAVKSERGHSEVLSIQGLGKLVWVLVALSLFAVSAVSSYIGNRKKMRRESHFTSFAESIWIHAADIVNNSVSCAKKVAAPLRYTRAWWLLGVVILIQFWCAGLKSNLLVDESFTIDSLEDLMSNPKIICYYKPISRLIDLLEDEDSKYNNLRQQLRRKGKVVYELDDKANDEFVSGKAVVIEESKMFLRPALLKKIKRNQRKLYVGKTKYEPFSAHMYFNKRLPRDIKERIDYV